MIYTHLRASLTDNLRLIYTAKNSSPLHHTIGLADGAPPPRRISRARTSSLDHRHVRPDRAPGDRKVRKRQRQSVHVQIQQPPLRDIRYETGGQTQDVDEAGVRGRRREGRGDARPRDGRRRDDAGVRRGHEDGMHEGRPGFVHRDTSHGERGIRDHGCVGHEPERDRGEGLASGGGGAGGTAIGMR
jgi:hypothetical protein